ncbi:MAG: hypothetical protein ACFFA3_21700 [Promethearchaeota archaeon]
MKKFNEKRNFILILLLLICCSLPLSFYEPRSNLELKPKPQLSSSSEFEDFSNEDHGTMGLDIEFVDEYHGYEPSPYCDQRIHQGPFTDPYGVEYWNVFIVRDNLLGGNTWSVHYLDTPLYVGHIEFSIWLNSGDPCTVPNNHIIKFRDKSDNVAFQFKFDLKSNNAYYYTGSTWSLFASMTRAEWYKVTISFNINSETYNSKIIHEGTNQIAGCLWDKPYQNLVPIEEVYFGTKNDHFSGNTRWDDFLFKKGDYVKDLDPYSKVGGECEWQVSELENIATPGDDKYNIHSGYNELANDVYRFDPLFPYTQLDERDIINRKVSSITVHILCMCTHFGGGNAKIKVSYSLDFDHGTWSSSQEVESQFDGWTSFRWDGLNLKMSDFDYLWVKFTADIEMDGIVAIDATYVEIEYVPEKIGIFFWTSDAGNNENKLNIYADDHIVDYRNVIYGEGYRQFYYQKDAIDDDEVNASFEEITEFVFESDIVFFYFWAHGNIDNGESLVDLNGYLGGYTELTNSDLAGYLEQIKSWRIGFLIESCYAGYFVLAFDDPEYTYLAITASDTSHESMNFGFEGVFSNHFWIGVGIWGKNAAEAYTWAKGFVINRGPMYNNNLYSQTGYMFFN